MSPTLPEQPVQSCEHEYFCVLNLETRHGVVAFQKMYRGKVEASAMHPRTVVKAALTRQAAAVILRGFAYPQRLRLGHFQRRDTVK
jgi:DNA repair protein RadC